MTCSQASSGNESLNSIYYVACGPYFFSRFRTQRQGYCSLCGNFSKLTDDHVPPQACGNSGVYDILDLQNPKFRMQALNGLKLRTICGGCNSEKLGRFDTSLSLFAIAFKKFLRQRDQFQLPGSHYIPLSPREIVRSVVGHLLAAFHPPSGSIEEPKFSDGYLQTLYSLFSGEFSLPHSVFVWSHPYSTIRLLPNLGLITDLENQNTIISCSVLSFYPVGFMVTSVQTIGNHSPLYRLRTDRDKDEVDANSLVQMAEGYPLENPPDMGGVLMLPGQSYWAVRTSGLFL